MANREDCIARLWAQRQNPCWLAFLDLLDVEIESARNKLEKADLEAFQRYQGKVEAFRSLKKALMSPSASSEAEQ